ncbi:glycosyltransferase [Leptolyngbya sp. FACHB-261]|uniref:glycosyltransferase n=1 Tax=Leptolyngbya sp. FACHB-261 TaxID=2692806 RepID=UPI0016892C62|nr:glycosyltransferase [Leptolyngbya sp. FACHB-261]MBD2104345.1 hypothetical protein [Leptolyngbya sp. FACHB-261]
MEKFSVLYFVEPMMGLGSHYWAQVLAKALVKQYENVELTVLIDDLVPFSVVHDRINWIKLPVCRNQVTEHGSLNFKLIDESGHEVDERWKQARIDCVSNAFNTIKPNVVLLHNHLSGLEWDKLIEFEYKTLVDLAHLAPWEPPVLASSMDFIDGFENQSDTEAKEYLCKVKEEVDYILVCGASLDLFMQSCPLAAQFQDKLILAGYPVDSTPLLPLAEVQEPEVIVAAGGSELGNQLFRAAIEAFGLAQRSPNCLLGQHPWRLLVGPHLKAEMAALQAMAEAVTTATGTQGRLIVQPTVSSAEYAARLMHHCVASVSQCGQSTFVDLERTGVPALVVPYEANGMVQEQLYRAQFLHNSGRGVLLREQNLSASSLLAGLEQALAIGPKRIGVNLTGAEFVAKFIHDLALSNQHRSSSRHSRQIDTHLRARQPSGASQPHFTDTPYLYR